MLMNGSNGQFISCENLSSKCDKLTRERDSLSLEVKML